MYFSTVVAVPCRHHYHPAYVRYCNDIWRRVTCELSRVVPADFFDISYLGLDVLCSPEHRLYSLGAKVEPSVTRRPVCVCHVVLPHVVPRRLRWSSG